MVAYIDTKASEHGAGPRVSSLTCQAWSQWAVKVGAGDSASSLNFGLAPSFTAGDDVLGADAAGCECNSSSKLIA